MSFVALIIIIIVITKDAYLTSRWSSIATLIAV